MSMAELPFFAVILERTESRRLSVAIESHRKTQLTFKKNLIFCYGILSVASDSRIGSSFQNDKYIAFTCTLTKITKIPKPATLPLRGRLRRSTKLRNTHYTKRCIEVRPLAGRYIGTSKLLSAFHTTFSNPYTCL